MANSCKNMDATLAKYLLERYGPVVLKRIQECTTRDYNEATAVQGFMCGINLNYECVENCADKCTKLSDFLPVNSLAFEIVYEQYTSLHGDISKELLGHMPVIVGSVRDMSSKKYAGYVYSTSRGLLYLL